ncbi:MAG TPA: lysylphosphatidylglycerol synthase domain-containing protein [Alphaproteobacteria bacterium]|nr:lysylphosphatidylglycerol synthase domain-containing protein [Alphaproteobacteria bacterium]
MRRATIAATVLGIAAGTALVGYFGFREVGRALFAVGWIGFFAIVIYHLAGMVLLGVCWYVLTPHSAPFRAFVWGRVIRDSASEVLPLSQLGGFILGARAAMLVGLSGAAAIASTIVDVTVEVLGQIGYTAIGLAILAHLRPDAPMVDWGALGLAGGLIAIVGFVTVQRRGSKLIERALWFVARRWSRGAMAAVRPVYDELTDIYSRGGAIGLAGILHLAAWIASSVEAWIALHLMGVDPGIAAVVAIESLLYAIRSVAFAIPNAVGVQEGAYVLFGGTFGLSPEIALALSLLKRARDLAIGVPALLAWQVLEGRRLLAQPATTS